MKIAGRQKFVAQLAAMPQAVKDEIRKALQVSAEETTDLMKRFAPVDSGDLRDSIGWTFGAPPEGSSVLASSARTAKGEAGLAVTMYAGDSAAFYARFQEFGTADMPANSFFYPGYRLGRKRAKSRIARAMRKGIKTAFSK